LRYLIFLKSVLDIRSDRFFQEHPCFMERLGVDGYVEVKAKAFPFGLTTMHYAPEREFHL
jgi:hypothetical protein